MDAQDQFDLTLAAWKQGVDGCVGEPVRVGHRQQMLAHGGVELVDGHVGKHC